MPAWRCNVQDESGLLSRTPVFALPPVLLWGLSGFLLKVAANQLPAEPAAFICLAAFVPVATFFGLRATWSAAITPGVWLIVLALARGVGGRA